jgi:hypothetical protein
MPSEWTVTIGIALTGADTTNPAPKAPAATIAAITYLRSIGLLLVFLRQESSLRRGNDRGGKAVPFGPSRIVAVESCGDGVSGARAAATG